MGLRETLEAATPGRWEVSYGASTGEPHLALWAGGFCIADDAFQYGRREDYELAALAPELASLCLDMGEEIQEKAKHHHRSWGHEKSFAKCIWPICESAREFAARLDRIGKEQT